MARFVKGQFVILPNKDQMLKLRGGSLSAYVALCSFANDEGQCFPSLATLSESTGYSVANVRRSLEDLLEQGLISKMARKRADGSKTSNVYQIEVCSPASIGMVASEQSLTKPINSNKKINKKNPDSSDISFGADVGAVNKPVAAADAETRRLMEYIISVVNPREKVTEGRMKALNGRLKDGYSPREIALTAQVLAQSKWHKENKQMTVDNLLAPSKFGRLFAQIDDATLKSDAPVQTQAQREAAERERIRREREEQDKRNQEFIDAGL